MVIKTLRRTQGSNNLNILWRPAYSSNTAWETYITSALIELTAIDFSVKSFKEKHGTAAMIIEGPAYKKHWIVSSCTSPGRAKDWGAYKSELAGIPHVVSIVEAIFHKHIITEGGI